MTGPIQAVDPATGRLLNRGLSVRTTPGTLRGWQIACQGCSCTVEASHVPYSPDCQEARRERDTSQAD